MRAAEIRRRRKLVRLHLGLLAASLLLCALHLGRHLSAPTEGRATVASALTDSGPFIVSRGAGPRINWGGHRQ